MANSDFIDFKKEAETSFINENDMFDRLVVGVPQNTIGTSAGSFGTFSSPDVSQSPLQFVQNGTNKIDPMDPIKGTPPSDEDINAIKKTVTPDEVLTGIDYELKKMVMKDKAKAKYIVISNLKKNPKFYSDLNMLHPDLPPEEPKTEPKDKVKSDEQGNFSITIKEEKVPVNKNEILNIFKDLSNTPVKNRYVDQRVVDAYKEVAKNKQNKRDR